MKPQYKYRKEWERVAEELKMQDTQNHVAATDPVTKKDYMILVNNNRRFVRGMCALPLEEQKAKLALFSNQMVELKEAQSQTKKEVEADLKGIVNKPEETK